MYQASFQVKYILCTGEGWCTSPKSFKQILYHIVFGLKFDLHHKACLVAKIETGYTRNSIYSDIMLMGTTYMGSINLVHFALPSIARRPTAIAPTHLGLVCK